MLQCENLQVVVDGFNAGSFLQCLGAMDDTYIRIVAPKYKPVDYWNSKQYP